MVRFEEAHAKFIQSHLDRRSGERRDRLERGHSHGERLFLQNEWWPLYGNFNQLHPEYEVLDWRGIPYYIDFAYIRSFIRIGFEIKGFGPHVRDSNRTKYSNELNREAFLTSNGWRIISFSYDDVKNRPEVVQMLIRMNLAPFMAGQPPVLKPTLIDNELVRLGFHLVRPIRPIDVEHHFGINHRTSIKWINQTCEKGWLRPIINGSRIVQYELARDVLHYWL
jgi:hypothetical protein